MMSLPQQVKIMEVGPRDGLQNESTIIPTATKINFINLLSESGLSSIEVSSFVSPKWIPQLADHTEVFQSINKKNGICYSALIPNLLGLEKALATGVKHIAVFTTPSEQFAKKNTNCSVDESLQRIENIIRVAKPIVHSIRAYISCVIDCPYEGYIKPDKVSALANQLITMGCDEISLGDTTGKGTPLQVQQLLDDITSHVPIKQLAVHFHDTYGQALANIYVALQKGISIIDSSVAGLGGCPYAKGASGNVATEDVIYMLNGMNIKTGIDLSKLMAASLLITQALNKEPLSKTSKALWALK